MLVALLLALADPFPPLQGDVWAAGAQFTVIPQWHPAFHSPYEGHNSLRGEEESATSVTGTLFFAARPWRGGFVGFAPEIGFGGGLSGVVGAGAFPNADIVRVPSLPPAPYVARLFVQQTFFGDAPEWGEDEGRFSPRSGLRGLTLTLGKFGINDLFDVSEASNDPRHRYLSWAIVNQGAWDYCADVRGYTWGAAVEYGTKALSVRAAACMMPTQANGPDLDTDLAHSRSEVGEVELRPRDGTTVSLLAYANHANAGVYATGDLTASRHPGAMKRGLSLHVEQQVERWLVFARAGANDGQTETFAYSEIDRSLSFGATWDGRAGVAYELGGLSREHADYLARGGLGFLLGDGALRYAPEQVLEGFVTLAVIRSVLVSLDGQLLIHPGFNADRGPVPIVAMRLHFHL